MLRGSDFKLNKKYNSRRAFEKYFTMCGSKVDLGCGYNKPKGYVGLDNGVGFGSQVENEDSMPDIWIDLEKNPIPFREETCSRVRAAHYLEHVDIDNAISDVYRVLIKDGIFEIILPYANSAEGMYAGHTSFYTEKWFENNIKFQKHFRIVDIYFKESDYWESLPFLVRKMIPFNFARLFFFNACCEMTLICKKREE